jgi:cytochrome c553
MNGRITACVVGVLAAVVVLGAQAYPPDFPLWAYGYITLPSTWQDYSVKCQGDTPSPCDRPGGLPVDPANTPRTLEGSPLSFTVAQINARFGPADWFPNDHPPMPDIVAHGKQSNGSRACSICHLPNGKGLMQNGGVAGLPKDYILRQLADFKAGKRRTFDPNKANGFEMQAIARNLTDAEAEAAADYFSKTTFSKWVRVVESTTVPRFTATVNGLFLQEEGTATEPLGQRIVELPEDTYQTNILRNPRSGFVAYVPPGSLARGALLAKTGGAVVQNGRTTLGPTTECFTCHGPKLEGTLLGPPIAGRSPGYIARQLYDMKMGTRKGDIAVATMKASVERLSTDDILALAAYVSSVEP